MTVFEAAATLRTVPSGYKTMDAFGKALGWAGERMGSRPLWGVLRR